MSHPIVKCLIAKVPESVKSLQAIKSALNKSDLTEASFLVKENAVYYNSDIDRWMSVEELKSLIPDGMVQTDQISTGKIFQKETINMNFC